MNWNFFELPLFWVGQVDFATILKHKTNQATGLPKNLYIFFKTVDEFKKLVQIHVIIFYIFT